MPCLQPAEVARPRATHDSPLGGPVWPSVRHGFDPSNDHGFMPPTCHCHAAQAERCTACTAACLK